MWDDGTTIDGGAGMPQQGSGTNTQGADSDPSVESPRPPSRPPVSTNVQLAALGALIALAVVRARWPDSTVDRDWLIALVAIVFGAEVSHRWPRT